MFAAAIYLRYKKPEVVREYKIPFGNVGIWVLGVLGILSCTGAVILGFIPPSQVKIGSLAVYETILIVGIIVLCVPPIIIYALRKPAWKNNKTTEIYKVLQNN